MEMAKQIFLSKTKIDATNYRLTFLKVKQLERTLCYRVLCMTTS